jgi:hypothetical protein
VFELEQNPLAVLLEVGDRDFYADLLFYHLRLRRCVVIELKAVPFAPEFVGQMNVYLAAVDELLRHLQLSRNSLRTCRQAYRRSRR